MPETLNSEHKRVSISRKVLEKYGYGNPNYLLDSKDPVLEKELAYRLDKYNM